MTSSVTVVLCLLLVVPGMASAQSLLANGDFEDSLAFWTVAYSSPQGTWEVSTGASHHPDPDNELYVFKAYQYYARASQTVDVPSTQLRFAVSAKLYTVVGSTAGKYAYATINLEYLNSAGAVLGRTMLIQKTPYCNFQNTSTQHLIVVTGADWQDYVLSVPQELESLPGIDPADVAKVSVVLEAYGNGTTG